MPEPKCSMSPNPFILQCKLQALCFAILGISTQTPSAPGTTF